MFDWLKQYNKAIISAIAAGALMFLKAWVGDHSLSADEIWEIVGSMAAAGGVTWWVPNKPQGSSTPQPPVRIS